MNRVRVLTLQFINVAEIILPINASHESVYLFRKLQASIKKFIVIATRCLYNRKMYNLHYLIIDYF